MCFEVTIQFTINDNDKSGSSNKYPWTTIELGRDIGVLKKGCIIGLTVLLARANGKLGLGNDIGVLNMRCIIGSTPILARANGRTTIMAFQTPRVIIIRLRVRKRKRKMSKRMLTARSGEV